VGVEIERLVEIEDGLLEAVVDLAALPICDLLLVAGAPLLEDHAGLLLPRSLLREARTRVFMERRHRPWQFGLALSARTCGFATTHRAYFAYVLGHELGHAHVAIVDPALHVYCCFLDHYIGEASGGRVTMWHELPHEHAHDQFGIAIAQELLGRGRVEGDFAELIRDDSRRDHQRLVATIALAPEKDYSTLREQLVTFARPFASELGALWTGNLAQAAAAGGTSLTQYAPHISLLFGEG
jgi:hypothetical protein